jgi:hypothetical protein
MFTASGYTMGEFEDGHPIDGEVMRFLSVDRQRDHFWCVLRAWRADGSSRRLSDLSLRISFACNGKSQNRPGQSGEPLARTDEGTGQITDGGPPYEWRLSDLSLRFLRFSFIYRASIVLCVDESEERRTVRLPEGISAGLQWVRLALVLTVTSSAT